MGGSSAGSDQFRLFRDLGDLMTTWWSREYRQGVIATAGVAVNDTDTQVLWELSFRGSCQPGALAGRIGVGAPAVTKSVRRLTAHGLLQAHSNPDDRRSTILSLTPEGENLVQSLVHAGEEMLAEILGDWTEREIGEFARLIERFTRASLDRGRRKAASGD